MLVFDHVCLRDVCPSGVLPAEPRLITPWLLPLFASCLTSSPTPVDLPALQNHFRLCNDNRHPRARMHSYRGATLDFGLEGRATRPPPNRLDAHGAI